MKGGAFKEVESTTAVSSELISKETKRKRGTEERRALIHSGHLACTHTSAASSHMHTHTHTVLRLVTPSTTERRHGSSICLESEGSPGSEKQLHLFRRASDIIPFISVPSHSLDLHPGVTLIKMRKGLQSGQAHTGHQHKKEVKERQHRRAEKKLLAFWMSLSHRTWTFFWPRERPGFRRSASAARLLKSEA